MKKLSIEGFVIESFVIDQDLAWIKVVTEGLRTKLTELCRLEQIPLFCSHEWVNTAMRKSWCKHCNADAVWDTSTMNWKPA